MRIRTATASVGGCGVPFPRLRAARSLKSLIEQENMYMCTYMGGITRDHEAGPRHSTVACPSERSSGGRGAACANR